MEREHCLECRPVFHVSRGIQNTIYGIQLGESSSEVNMQPLHAQTTLLHPIPVIINCISEETDLLQSVCHLESRDFSVYFVYVVLNFVTKI